MKLNRKRILTVVALVAMFVMVLSMNVFAADDDDPTGLNEIAEPIVNALNSLMTPVLAIVGAAGSLYCVLLGVKFAKAEEPQDREKAKSHLKNAIIGFVLIFVLLLALRIGLKYLPNWVNSNT